MLLDPRNGPEYDLPANPAAQTYLIASTPRTGSTLLARMLWGTGVAGAPKEYLNPMQIRDWELRFGSTTSKLRHRLLTGRAVGLAGRARWTDRRLQTYLQTVRAHRTGAWFGMKIHWHHFDRFFHRPQRRPEDWLGPITWIRIRRADPVAQAISWSIALQTNQWISTARAAQTPRYTRHTITSLITKIQRDEASWDRYLSRENHLHIQYEQLASHPNTTLQRVLSYLRCPEYTLSELPLQPQAQQRNLDWAERYRAGR